MDLARRRDSARPVSSVRTTLVVALGVLAALAAAPLAGPPAAVAGLPSPVAAGPATARATTSTERAPHATLEFVTHNIEHKGYGRGHGDPHSPGRAIEHALSVASAAGPHGASALMLQEVCADQAARLAHDHPTWRVNYHPTGQPLVAGSCGTTGPFDTPIEIGDLVAWTRPGPVAARAVDLDPRDDEVDFLGRRTARGPALVCLDAVERRIPFRVCSVHRASEGRRSATFAAVGRLARLWQQQGREVVIGGDFNATPSNPLMSPMYRIGGRGTLQDADGFGPRAEDGSDTVRRGGSYAPTHFSRCADTVNKIDYVFAGSARVSDRAERRVRTYYTASPSRPRDRDCARMIAAGKDAYSDQSSDHFVLRATIRFRTGPRSAG